MFDSVAKLYWNFKLYVEGKPYDFEHSTLDVSKYFINQQLMET